MNKQILNTALLILAFIHFGCNALPENVTLEAMVHFGLQHPGQNFCVGNGNDEAQKLLSDANFDCMAVKVGSASGEEDSVLVLVRKKLSEVEYLYYDFARQSRNLETWEQDGDKRSKIGDRLYQRSLAVE